MLPSLRPLIAESMVGLAVALQERGKSMSVLSPAIDAASRGAATLRWCDENDPDADLCGHADQMEELLTALDGVRAAVLAWDTSTGTKGHAELCDEISEILAEVGL